MGQGNNSKGVPILAVALIIDKKTGNFLLQHRDDNDTASPGKWGLFGGHVEDGETPLTGALRELEEEIGVTLDAADLKPWDDYVAKNEYRRHVFLVESLDGSAKIDLGEGQGYEWISPDRVLAYDLTEMTRKDITKIIEK